MLLVGDKDEQLVILDANIEEGKEESMGDERQDCEVNEVQSETSSSKAKKAQDVERFNEALRKLEDSPPLEERSFIKECEITFSRKPWQDHRCLPIPCPIGEVDIEGAVCDFNSRLYWMTYSLAERLGFNLESMVIIDMELTLADDSEIYLVGILYVPIKVIGLEMKLDFVIIDDVSGEIPISFGRLMTGISTVFLVVLLVVI
jgi:hypothetical protein